MELRDKNGLTEKEFLAGYKADRYPRPSVTADILIFAKENDSSELLLIKRAGHPFLGDWALPGGFVMPGESVDQAAERELLEETHIKGIPLVQLRMFSEPGRDPRGWVISQAYMAMVRKQDVHIRADDDSAEAKWFTVCQEHCKEGKIRLVLMAHGIELSAMMAVQEIEMPWGESRWRLQILQCNGIAFDHAKMILNALLRMKR